MAARPVADWLVPQLNGRVRLQKPPLSYWASAASFSVFGVGDRAGRLPAVLAAWATIGLTYAFARQLFPSTVGLLSTAVLAGTYLGVRHGLLAESDTYATAFVVAGIYTAKQAFDDAEARRTLWLHATAISIAGATMAKGPPAAYVVFFALLVAWGRRDARTVLQFFTRGSVATLLALALPWFLYIARHLPGNGQLQGDAFNSAEGGDHHGPPWAYVWLLMRSTLPWTFVWMAALILASIVLWSDLTRRWALRRTPTLDPNPRVPPCHAELRSLYLLSAWTIAVLRPLSLWGNKQIHYLLPLMPAVAILIGWGLERSVRDPGTFRGLSAVVGLTTVALSLSGVAFVAADGRQSSIQRWPDVALAAGLLAAGVGVVLVWQRAGRRAAYFGTAVMASCVVCAGATRWPSVIAETQNRADVAASLQGSFPDAAFAFRGVELPLLSYTMRRVIPTLDRPDLATDVEPRRVLLEQQQSDKKTPQVSTGFFGTRCYDEGENRLHVFVRASSPFSVSGSSSGQTDGLDRVDDVSHSPGGAGIVARR